MESLSVFHLPNRNCYAYFSSFFLVKKFGKKMKLLWQVLKEFLHWFN